MATTSFVIPQQKPLEDPLAHHDPPLQAPSEVRDLVCTGPLAEPAPGRVPAVIAARTLRSALLPASCRNSEQDCAKDLLALRVG